MAKTFVECIVKMFLQFFLKLYLIFVYLCTFRIPSSVSSQVQKLIKNK